MTNLFDDAFDVLGDEMRAAAGIPIVYTVKETDATVETTAVQGFTNHRVLDQNGATVNVRTDDFHVAVADLVVDSEPVRPRIGDLIAYVRGGIRKTFKVAAVDQQNCFQQVDHESAYRIHAVLHKTESV